MLDGLGDSVTWYCDNCDDIMPVGHEAYRMPDGTILCSEVCVDDYALYSKVIKLCADYFPFLFEKKA